MIDYYKILNIKKFDISNIDVAFKKALNQYKNLPFYSNKMKEEIKIIKEAFYVLSNEKLMMAYNERLKNDNKYYDSQKLSRDQIRNSSNNSLYFRNFDVIQKKKKILNMRIN